MSSGIYSKRRVYASLLAAVLLVAVLILVGGSMGSAQSSVIPADMAVRAALLGVSSGSPIMAPYKDTPTEIRGRLMSYGDAVQWVDGRPIGANEGIYKMRGTPVWVIALRGTFIGQVPSGPSVLAKNVVHSQMIVFVDATTAQVMGVHLVAPQQEFPVASLSVLGLPRGTLPPFPTSAPIQTEAPMATRPPARPK